MATLDDLQDVLQSIDRSMTDQKRLLTNMFNLQQTNSRLSSVNTSTLSSAASVGQGVGSAASGIGQGVGSAALGLGLGGLAGLAALEMFADFDAQKVKDNVVTLLSISDEVGGKVEMLKEGGTFFLAMTGLAAGLAAFGVGQTLVGLGQWITEDQWTKTLKTNVLDLFSIADEVGGNLTLLYEGGTVGLALGGLGAGLIAFGTGQTLVGLGQWITDTDWAEKVKENVNTLLSIKDDLDGTDVLFAGATFPLAMTGLGIGLSTFAVGNAAAGLAQFVSTDDWAQQIKDSVATLLSISELPGIGWNTVEFIGVMSGIAAGLTAFALGKGAATVVDGASEALAYFTGDEPFADKIKSEVETLLSIVGLAPEGSVDDFTNIMSKLGSGLSSFAGGNFVGALKNVGTALLSFFSGQESPFEQIRLIASDADNLVKAADAIEKIADSLKAFGSIDVNVGSVDFVKLAENLGKAVPLLDALANGGEVAGSDGWLSSPLIFPKSILDPSLKLDEMAEAISKVNYILGQTTKYPVGLQESAAAAVAESPVASNQANQAMAEMQLTNNFQPAFNSLSEVGSVGTGAKLTFANSGNTYGGSTIINSKTDVNMGAKTYSEFAPRSGRPSNVQ